MEESVEKLHPDRTVLVQHDGAQGGAWKSLPQRQLEDWGIWPLTPEMVQSPAAANSTTVASSRSDYCPERREGGCNRASRATAGTHLRVADAR